MDWLAFHNEGRAVAKRALRGEGEGEFEGIAFNAGISPDYHNHALNAHGCFGKHDFFQFFNKTLG